MKPGKLLSPAVQIMNGFMEGQQQRKKMEQQQKLEKFFEQAMQSGELEPEFSWSSDKGMTMSLKKPKEKKGMSSSERNSIIGDVGAGTVSPNSLDSRQQESLLPFSPLTTPTTEGGEAGLTPGSRMQDGLLLGPGGEYQGDYLPGFEDMLSPNMGMAPQVIQQQAAQNPAFARKTGMMASGGSERKLSRVETFNQELNDIQSGKADPEQLKVKYVGEPKKIQEIERIRKSMIPVAKSSDFREGKGLSAYFNNNVANLTPRAKTMVNAITDQYMLGKFLGEVNENIEKGKFTEAEKRQVFEYFGLDQNGQPRANSNPTPMPGQSPNRALPGPMPGAMPEQPNVMPGALPNWIKTTSQAVSYLTSQGMSEQDAVNYLRQNDL